MAPGCLSCAHIVPEGRVLFCTIKRGCVLPGAVCSRYENFKDKMAKKLEELKPLFPVETCTQKAPLLTPVQTSENLHTITGYASTSTPKLAHCRGGEDD